MKGHDALVGERGWCEECERVSLEGPDVCLGYIPGVSHACCGHGGLTNPYVVIGGRPNQDFQEMEEGVDCLVLDGEDALTFFDLVRGAKQKVEI